MTWGDLMQDWHDHLEHLCDLFPYADICALVRFRGSRALLIEYIADTHDLTLAEAKDAIELRFLAGLGRPTEEAGIRSAA